MTHPLAGALDGITVLDLSRVLAGPYATMILGDMGARILKIEQPGRGDDTRQWGPPFTQNGESAYFFCANRNKESITVNLKHPEGQRILRSLAAKADVLVENFKVGAMADFGLDYHSLQAINPGLIYCSITGYGQTGPYRHRPGYDIVIEAQAGIMSITGPAEDEGGEPYKVGVAIVDITAGLHAVIAIQSALYHRQRTGEGQHIDIALYDTQLSWLANIASSYLVANKPPQRFGNAHPSIVPYQTVSTADGWLMLAVGNDGQFSRLCQVLGNPAWGEDARFATNAARVSNRAILIPLLEECFAQKAASQWEELLQAAGVPCSPVNDIPTALHDPHTTARNMVQSIEHPITGTIPLLGPVAKMSATQPSIRLAPPLLGEHTESVLCELMDLDVDSLIEFRRNGVI